MQHVYLVYSDDYDPRERHTVARKTWQPGMVEPAYVDTMRRTVKAVADSPNEDDDTGAVYVSHDATPQAQPRISVDGHGPVRGAISGLIIFVVLAVIWHLLTAGQLLAAALVLGIAVFGAYGLTHGQEENQ